VKTKLFRVVALAAALGRSVAQAFNQRSVDAFMKLVDVKFAAWARARK